MKVFHIGITAPTYSSEAITQSFKEEFGDCLYFDWQGHRFNYGVEIMRNNMILEAKTYKPDIIFVHCNNNSEAIVEETYKALSEIGFVISYTEDVRENIEWFEKISPLVGLVIFTNIDDVETLNKKGFNNVHYLPVSYNHLWFKKQPKTNRNYGDIVFLGSNYVGTNLNFPQAQQRQDMIAAMKKEFGAKFQAYGRGQENPSLTPQQSVEAYNNAKIAIGHNNFSRKGYQSDRCLNAMACGCATLMQWYDGIENKFVGNVHWETIEQLIKGCNKFLDDTPKPEYSGQTIWWTLGELQRLEVTKNHTWINRCNEINDLILSIK